jgi:hypothetical protein
VRRTVAVVVAVAALVAAPAAAAAAAGTFHASDPKLDAIWSAGARTAADMLAPGPLTKDWLGRPCAIDEPVVLLDGVVRDRCPYVGDEAVIDATLDVSTPRWDVQRDMLAWFAAHQHADGSIPASPLNGGSLVLYDYNGYWVQTLYGYALASGDLAFVRRVWPSLERVLAWYAAQPTSGGLVVNALGALDYGYIHRHGTVVAYENAQYVLALREAAQLARWVGASAEATAWTTAADAVARRFDAAFWDASSKAFADTTLDRATHPQDGNAFAILAGIATPAEATGALAWLDAHDRRDYGNTIVDSDTWDGPAWGLGAADRVYPFMSYWELLARFQEGLDDSAIYLIRREWGYMLAHGPGTDWETIGPDGGPPTDQHPSWDAGWSSGAAPALTAYVLGVRPTSPGYATFTVTPHPSGLEWATGKVPTPHGTIHVSWKLQNGKPVVKVTAPRGTTWTNPPRRRA